MLTFYCMPWSRSSGVFWLLEEIGSPYEIELIDIRAPAGVPESYRSIQPNKKVPAIDHDGTIVTERAAITIYLADAFPEAGLAPPIGDSRRAAYLTRLVYCDSVLDPVIAARAQAGATRVATASRSACSKTWWPIWKECFPPSPMPWETALPQPTRNSPQASTSR